MKITKDSLCKLLLEEHNKNQARKIAGLIAEQPASLKTLMKLIFGTNQEIARRAAWVSCTISELYDLDFSQWYPEMIHILSKSGLHNAVKRDILKVLETADLPESLQGEAAEIGLKLIADPEEAIAIRCFAMTLVANICKKHPDLIQELVLVIKKSLPYSSAGFRARTKRTFLELKNYS